MADFVLTPTAEGDIVGILDYIDHDNPPAALRVREALLDACDCSPSAPARVKMSIPPANKYGWITASFQNATLRWKISGIR